ncbi:MFS transporter [Flavobacteriaceae bacterium]|nr:MFS transporter [Flavobacteriaceae bacterium]
MGSLKTKTYKRYNVLTLIFITVVINYMDRSNISVASSAITQELGLTKIQMGLIFSAFAWSYSSLQIPGGIIVDYVKPRILYPFMIVLWSIATLLQGFVSSLGTLVGCRIAIGAFEAPSYPCNNKIVTSWFPEKERASAIAVYTSGQFIGLAFLTPVLILIQSVLGWRGLFIVSGVIGIIWALIWYVFYRDPKNHTKVSQEELRYIEEGGGLISHLTVEKEEQKFNWNDVKLAFSYRKLWGVYLGQFCLGSLFIFFLTWFPTYLVEYRGLDFIKSVFLASVPFLAAFVGVLLSGYTSDFLIRKNYSNELARKAPILVGMFLSLAIIGANYTDNTTLIIFFLSLAFFGNGLASITWVFVSLLAPKKMIGLVGGVFNFIGGLSAAVTPIVIGWLAQDGNFKPALFYIGILAFIGFCSYLFLVGKLKRIDVKSF